MELEAALSVVIVFRFCGSRKIQGENVMMLLKYPQNVLLDNLYKNMIIKISLRRLDGKSHRTDDGRTKKRFGSASVRLEGSHRIFSLLARQNDGITSEDGSWTTKERHTRATKLNSYIMCGIIGILLADQNANVRQKFRVTTFQHHISSRETHHSHSLLSVF